MTDVQPITKHSFKLAVFSPCNFIEIDYSCPEAIWSQKIKKIDATAELSTFDISNVSTSVFSHNAVHGTLTHGC